MPISVDFEQQLRGPWDTASGFLIDQLELLQAQLAPIIAAASATPGPTYDEGTWTPTITGDGGGSGQTYLTQQGGYIKIGKQVTVWCYVQLTAKGTITGNVIIGGLPFPTRAGFYLGAVMWAGLATAFVNVTALIQSQKPWIYPIGIGAAGTANNAVMTTAAIGNSTAFFTTLTYFTP